MYYFKISESADQLSQRKFYSGLSLGQFTSQLLSLYSIKYSNIFYLPYLFICTSYLFFLRHLRRVIKYLLLLNALLLMMLSSLSYAALTAMTANTIKGSAPQFVTSGSDAINLIDFKYFGLHLYGNDTDYFDPAEFDAALDTAGYKAATLTPFELYRWGHIAISNITTGAPTSEEIIGGDGVNPEKIILANSGQPIAGWYYGSETEILLTDAEQHQTFCELALAGKIPYLKISSIILLKTTYGDPSTQIYPDVAAGLTITPTRNFSILQGGHVCSAMPDINRGNSGGDPNLNRPPQTGIWSPDIGFFPQAVGKDNFPTTGMDGLYFDLIIVGVDASTLTWSSPMMSGNVTVTVTPYTVSPNKETRVKVTLTGPKVSKDAVNMPTSSVASAFGGPANFTIKGNNGSNTVISYPFTIKKWYVNGGAKGGNWSQQKTWCQSLSGNHYDLPSVSELTNASNHFQSIAGTSPTNIFQRRIGGGLFSEWGQIYDYYLNAGLPPAYGSYINGFYTNLFREADADAGMSGATSAVYVSHLGTIDIHYASMLRYAVCVSQP